MLDSIWAKSVDLPQFPKLQGDFKTDVLIIGGGMAGILCAYMLQADGVDCALIESDRILHGVSRNTTAKITSQHGLIYGKLLQKFGEDAAYAYWQANEEALQTLRSLAQQADCDFEDKNHYIYTTDSVEQLLGEMEALEHAGIPAHWEEKTSLPFPVNGAIRFADQAQFHPLKFAAHLVKKLRIYENTPALEFGKNTVTTPEGKVFAKKIIVATHFPVLNKHGAYFLKLYQQRSYVLALDHAAQLDGMYLSDKTNGLSFRNAGDVLLLGGGGHRTGKKGGGWAELQRFARKYYPDAREVCRWATQDCMSLDSMPYIGPYSQSTDGLYVATGFNKWGMTSSMVSAMILRDLVQEQNNPYADLFSPSRSILQPQLLCNGAQALLHLLTPTKPRCPHMGCALKWNAREHSWDCPCHGSRFDQQGKLLDNPATGDLPNPPGMQS